MELAIAAGNGNIDEDDGYYDDECSESSLEKNCHSPLVILLAAGFHCC